MADITPTTTGYIRILQLIARESTHTIDVRWALQELERIGESECQQ